MAEDSLEMQSKAFKSQLGGDVPHIYMNGFALGQSLSDVTAIIQTNGSTTAILNMSFTSAKSFAIELDKVIKRFESVTGQPLLTMEDIKQRTSDKK